MEKGREERMGKVRMYVRKKEITRGRWKGSSTTDTHTHLTSAIAHKTHSSLKVPAVRNVCE